MIAANEVPNLKSKGWVPEVSLKSSRDARWNIHDRLRRKNIVLLFIDDLYCDKCRARLKAFARDYQSWRRMNSEIVVILPNSQNELKNLSAELELPFDLLSDEKSEARSAFTFDQLDNPQPPMIFVVDRLSTLYYHPISDDTDSWTEAREVYEEVEFLEGKCPECGVYG